VLKKKLINVGRPNEYRGAERGQHRSASLRRLMHVLRVTATARARPNSSATNAPIRASGDSVGNLLQRRATGKGGRRRVRLTLANSMVFSLSNGSTTVAGATFEALSARMVSCSSLSPQRDFKMAPAALYGPAPES